MNDHERFKAQLRDLQSDLARMDAMLTARIRRADRRPLLARLADRLAARRG